MSIKGLTDVQRDFGRGLPKIATLYKGDEKGNNRPGRDLKHFRIEFEPQFEQLRSIWLELYGEQPTEFGSVFIAQNTAEEAFSCWKEEWSATSMLHRCDGEHQVRWFDRRTGNYVSAKIDCAAGDMPPCACKPVGRLNLLFPEFIDAAGVLGFIAVATHSLHDIIALNGYLGDIERVYQRLTGIEFVFGRADKEISVPKPNSRERMKVVKSLLYIRVSARDTKDTLLPILAGAMQPALPGNVPAAGDDIRQIAAKARANYNNAGNRRIGGLSSEALAASVNAGGMDNDE